MMETGSQFAKIIPGTSDTLDIIWSESGVKPGKFAFEEQGKGVNTKLLLNMHKNTLYQFGIPGITNTADGIVDWLKLKINQLGAKHIRTFGHSAGASAAIGFGYMINADTVIAVGPEIELGVPRYRSFEWSVEKQYHPRFRDLRKTVRDLGDRLQIYFPAFDTSDYRSIHAVMEVPNVKITYLRSMHSGGAIVNWTKLAKAPGPVSDDEILLRQPFNWNYNREAVWQGAASFEAIGKADKFSAKMLENLMNIHPHIGLFYRLAIQRALLGDLVAAEKLWRKAKVNPAITSGRVAMEYRTILKREDFLRLKNYIEILSPRKKKPALPQSQAAHDMAAAPQMALAE